MADFIVLVDENSRYRDDEPSYQHGVFATYVEAVLACQRIVDEFLLLQRRPGMTAEELYQLYTHFGEDPYIVPDGNGRGPRFSAWQYARLRAHQICGELT